MYSTILLEDFASLKKKVLLTQPVSAFLIGLLAGFRSSSSSPSITVTGIKISVGFHIKAWATLLLNASERTLVKQLSPIINKFTTPVDKVVEELKDSSFVKPNSKLFDIIRYATTIVLLFLGYTISQLILLLFDKDYKKENLFNNLKAFIKNLLTSFIIVLAFWIPELIFSGKFIKFNYDEFRTSDDKIKQAIAKAYDLTINKYPKFTSVPLYYKITKSNTTGFFCMKLTSKNVIGIPKSLTLPLTDDELVALYLHEFGYLLHGYSYSMINSYVVGALFYAVKSFSSAPWTQIVASIGSDLLDRFYEAVTLYNQEIYADTFAVSMGYGSQLKSALQKLKPPKLTAKSTLFNVKHNLLIHPVTGERLRYIEQAEKYYQQQTNELVQKATEIIKEELNKEKASV
jgi:Zn-dependent protease with chaperone function